VHLIGGCSLRWCLEKAKSCFFMAFNAILSKTGRCASEPVILSSLRSKCMPILLHAAEACPLLGRQILSIEFTLTRIFMKLFRTESPNTANECRVNFGFLPDKYQISIRTAKFLRKFIASKIVYVHCLSVTRASRYMAYSCNSRKIFNLHVSCAMSFITIFDN